MTINPLSKGGAGEKSPTDPQECCDWANARMHPDAAKMGYRWVITGNANKPIEMRRFY